MDSELQSELASWTSRALGAFAVESHMPASPGTIACAGESATTTTVSTVASVLQRAARRLNQRHPLCNLPRPVILCMCSYLNNLDILMLSHTSHGARAALLGVPELWSSVPILPAEIWITEVSSVSRVILSSYLERSDPVPFHARLVLTGNAVSEQIQLLVSNMHRMAELRLLCAHNVDEPPGIHWSSLLKYILCEPAPQLTTLHLFYTPPPSKEGPLELEPLVMWDIFSFSAPALRLVKLSLVRLPATLDYPAFQNITFFFYDLYGRTTASDLRILSNMPRLEVFRWGGEFAPAEDDTATMDSSLAESCPRSLHTVLLSLRHGPAAPDLRSILPLRQLRELWIAGAAPEPGETIPCLYAESTVQGASVCCNLSGLSILLHVVHPGDGEETRVVVNSRHIQTLLSSLLAPFASITWLTVSDYMWDSDITGAPPVLPAVTVLTVCLASLDDYMREWNGNFFFGPCEWSASIFTADPACRWTLPALREVRVTSQPQAERGASSAGEQTLSVSLEDIARWLRHGITIEPPGRKLDVLVLSGLRIIDHDFCVAWDRIMALSHSLELREKPDTLHHTAAADMDFRLRSESFTNDGNLVW